MSLAAVQRLAATGRLYPSLILHGGGGEERRQAAVSLARILLCEREEGARPCGECRHCRRIEWPGGEVDVFHPDFQVLERDLRTATSVQAAKEFLRLAQVAPFEARGQVFAVADAESLSGEAANAFLKTLEEPDIRVPRNFFLLAPSQFDLLPTLRSRSMSLYLGGAERPAEKRCAELAERLTAFLGEPGGAGLLSVAEVLKSCGGWEDPRDQRPWSVAAAAVSHAARSGELPRPLRSALLELAQELLEAPAMRVRGITPQRILEGLVHRHLAGL